MIVSITPPRAAKMAVDTTSPTVVIRFKVQGHAKEFSTVAMNPYYQEPREQDGDGFNLGKSLKSVGKVLKQATPVGEAMVAIGAATGQPEIAALGATTIAASKLAGGARQKKKATLNAPHADSANAGRYSITMDGSKR